MALGWYPISEAFERTSRLRSSGILGLFLRASETVTCDIPNARPISRIVTGLDSGGNDSMNDLILCSGHQREHFATDAVKELSLIHI